MDESERIDYLQRKVQEEEQRKKKEEEDKRAEEEAALLAAGEARLQAELLARYSTGGVWFLGSLTEGSVKKKKKRC